jgi:hypothetical protein
LHDHGAARQHRDVTTPFGIPITYQDQRFPARKALAEHLAPLLGRSVAAVVAAIGRYGVAEALDRLNGVPPAPRPARPPDNSRPITYQGRQFTSRKALADHLAPLLGKSSTAIQKALSRNNGDVQRILADVQPRAGRS